MVTEFGKSHLSLIRGLGHQLITFQRNLNSEFRD